LGPPARPDSLVITLGSPSPRPNPQKLLVPAYDLLAVARDLTAAG
jgi:hypothetical protein